MATVDLQEFRIVNGHCHILNGTIHLENNAMSTGPDRWFGRNLLRRSLIFAVIFGIPLAIVGVALVKHGHLATAVWPIGLSVISVNSPAFYIGYSNPSTITISDIEVVTHHAPKRVGTLGSFNIHFLNDGSHARTTVLLPYAEYNVRQQDFQNACTVLTNAGITLVGDAKSAA